MWVSTTHLITTNFINIQPYPDMILRLDSLNVVKTPVDLVFLFNLY